jgi:hypothetical protein
VFNFFKKTVDLDPSQEEILKTHLGLLKNSSLFRNYPGLIPNHNSVSLIFALASRDPDTTIAVRAANEYSIQKTNFSVIMNPELATINKFKGVGDIKFCRHYFSGNVSDRINKTSGLACYQEMLFICKIYYAVSHPRRGMIFESDPYVFGFLTLFKLGKCIYTNENIGLKSCLLYKLLNRPKVTICF